MFKRIFYAGIGFIAGTLFGWATLGWLIENIPIWIAKAFA